MGSERERPTLGSANRALGVDRQMSAAQPIPATHPLGHYLAIAIAVAGISTLAVAAPSALIGLSILVAPFLLVGLATDVDPLDLAADDRGSFGPELRVLPTV